METRHRNDKAKPGDNRLLPACIASALLAGGFGMPALAGSALQTFDIPAQPMDSALTELADRAGLRLLYQAGAVGALRSRPVSGRHTPEQALRIMLADSGLEYRKTAGDTITVEKSTKRASAPASGNVELPPMTVTGAAEYDSTDPYNKNYAIRNSSTATKTDTPLIETPVSLQIVPRTVMDDQKSTRIKDALENVSGVRARPTLGLGTGFIIRGFQNDRVYRNGLLFGNDGFPGEFDVGNLQSIEVLKGPAAVLYGRMRV